MSLEIDSVSPRSARCPARRAWARQPPRRPEIGPSEFATLFEQRHRQCEPDGAERRQLSDAFQRGDPGVELRR